MFDALIKFLSAPLAFLTHPASQYYWATYLGSAVAMVAIFLVVKRGRLGLASIGKLLFPKRLLLHKSTWLDFKLFWLGSYYLLVQILLVGGLTYVTVPGTVKALDAWFGTAPWPIGASWIVTAGSMLLVFLAVELGYWATHFMMHKIPALWEFHKVHHSAEVLTPLTEWRQHPLELALFPVLVGAASCFVQGPIVWAFGASAQILDPVKANLLSMAFWYTTVHLRHSELPLYASGWLAKLIQTPSHHQVHHSTDPRHFDKNLGYCLSLWDWVFGTLYIPKKGEKLSYGLGHADTPLETAIGSLVAPFGRAGALVATSLRAVTEAIRARWRKVRPATQ
jgi:sterol desaturase/sphingolipid hydroxylase (fatty acid hydroxylase superfamily)